MITKTQPVSSMQAAPAQPASGQNPLDNLRDIHLPQELSLIELAPGWWFVIALILIGLIYLFRLWLKRRRALVLLKPAKAELAQIAQLPASSQTIAQLSALLKRVCLVYFPASQVASLSGSSWLEFLNNQLKQPLFGAQDQQVFNQQLYQANASVDPLLLQQLVEVSGQVIEQIIKTQGRRSL